jgi:hypothetical protein
MEYVYTTVFEGNTADSATVGEQLVSLKKELGISEFIFVGDRGMQIMYHPENDENLKDINFITGLTRSGIDDLLKRDVIELSLFSRELAEVTEGDKRYILSVNPELEASGRLYHKHRKDHTDELLKLINTSNAANNAQLSFNDIVAEINNVKLCELKIGKGEKLLAIPDLNPIQKKIFQLFNINPDDMIR